MDKLFAGFNYSECKILELPTEDQELINSAQLAAENAYAPYSKFRVGAACRLANSEIIAGNNQENAAYPSGLCAERVAMFYASSKYPGVPVEKLAITTSDRDLRPLLKPVTPCGACRQVIAETASNQNIPIQVLLVGKEKIIIIDDAKDLLPLLFSASSLL